MIKYINKIRILLLAVFSLSLFIFTACSDTSTNGQNGIGTLAVKITDAPFPIDNIVRADVTINKIDIRNDDGDDGNPFITVFEGDTTFNLLELRNGITSDLPELEIPVGNYNLIRLYVTKAEIELKDGRLFDLKIPGGAQTGIKIFIKPSIQVEGGLTSELLLDFDLGRSFVVQGNPNTMAGIKGFHFKPVIKAMNLSTAGRILGTVSDTSNTALENAEVWVEQDSIIATTFTDESGDYLFAGTAAGTYTVYAAKSGYDTLSVSGIEIVAGNQIEQDFVLTPQ